MRTNKYNDEFRQKAIARLKGGEPQREILKDLKITSSMLYGWFEKLTGTKWSAFRTGGAKKKKGYTAHSSDLALKTVARVRAGERVPALSKELGISLHTIYGWVHRFKNMPTIEHVNGASVEQTALNLQGVVHDAIVYLREVRKFVTADIRAGKKAEMSRGELHALLALSELEKVAR